MAENCYFWIHDSVSMEHGKRTVNVLCEKCHQANPKLGGWFWEGSRLGYGPFDFICGKCGHVIHSAPQK